MSLNKVDSNLSDFVITRSASFETPIKENILDPYSDKAVNLKFLNSKPSCFVIMGKPGAGCSTLAKSLVDDHQCEYINGKDLIEQHLESKSENATRFRTILEDGGLLTDDVVVDLIREKIGSPEVAHRGYILDGFPNASFQNVNVLEQFNVLKSFKMQPDYLIYLKIPDGDVNDRLLSQRFDPQTGQIYFKENYDPDFPPAIEVPPQIIVKKEKTGNEEEEEEEEDEEEILEEGEEGAKGNPNFPLLDPETIKQLLKRPEDFADKVKAKMENYTMKSSEIINDYIDNFNNINVMSFNANLPPQTLYTQLKERLRYFHMRPAAIPIELFHVPGEGEEEEDTPDGSDIDELFRELSTKNIPSPGFRWLKSELMNYCPVSLHQGILQPGKPQFAVGFLNKLYLMSDKDKMNLFVRNPRPYLLPPHPQIPCKIAVVGSKNSGKTTLCHLLANAYDAKIIDMVEIMKPHEMIARKEYLEKTLEKAIKDSIESVKAKIKKKMEIERADEMATEAIETLRNDTIDSIVENAEDKVVNDILKGFKEKKRPKRKSEDTSEDTIKGPPSIEEEIVKDLPKKLPEIFVDEWNPEVQELIKMKMEEAEKHQLTLPLEIYLEELEKEIKIADEEVQQREPNSKIHGCWILDNFPTRRDQWTGLLESDPMKYLVPDQVIVLKDSSEGNQYLLKRWYKNNKEQVDKAVAARFPEKLDEKEAAKPDQEIALPIDQELPPPGPEMTAARKEIVDWDQNWIGVTNIISNAPVHVETIELNISDKTVDELFHNAKDELEKIFKSIATEVTGVDLEEQDEDEAATGEEEQEEEEEEEEEQEGDEEEPKRSKKKPLGDVNYWCPVALKTQGVIWPGNPEIAAKYLGKIYYFADEESREKFLSNPLSFIPIEEIPKAPPIRLFILGAKGSGKTMHGRNLAEKLGLFHISFHEMLQEYILPKNRKKIGIEYNDDDPIPDFILPDLLNDDIEKKSPQKDSTEEDDERQKNNLNAAEEENIPERKLEEAEEWDEYETAIKENLESQQPLSTDLLKRILYDLWHKEPFKSKGFILEGFPRNAEEAQFISENGLFVDGVISLQTSDDDVVSRLLPARMAKWKERKAKKDFNKLKAKEFKQMKKQLKMDKRKKEIMLDLEMKRNAKYGPRSSGKVASAKEDEEEEEAEDEEDLEEEVNIDDMLAEEFEEEEEEAEEEEEELEEEAIERITTEITEIYDTDTNEISSVMESLQEMQIPRFEIEAGAKPTIVRYRINKKLKKLLERRESLFERCYSVSTKVAENLLKSGYKQFSRFGRWCPVLLSKGKNPMMPMVDETHPTFPVIYREHIYFLSSKPMKEQFMLNPLHYTKGHSPKDSVPLKLCILGLPKSGKTTLATRFVKEYGVLRITGGNALRNVLNENWNSELAKEIKDYLDKGLIVPHELVVKAIDVMMMDSICTTRGYVIDGYPLHFDQIKMMHDKGIIPMRVIELITSPIDLILRANKDKIRIQLPFPMHDSSKIIAMKMAKYESNISDIRKWYGEEHENIRSIDAGKSTWCMWELTNNDVTTQIQNIQNYLFNRKEGKAANIYDLGIRPMEFQSRLSNLKEYCPVRLYKHKELVNLNQLSSLRYCAEYKGYYYKLSGEKELAYFYENAEKVLSSVELPEYLPEKIDPLKIQDMFPIQLNLQGYCPVCFLEGKCRYEGLILGNKEKFVVKYKDVIFAFCSEKCLHNFMMFPSKYCNLELPKKLPPMKNSLNVKSLPLPGYLEQTMADALRNALTATGTLKPKYPFINPSRSALVYIALHLKAFNPKSAEYLRKKYKRKLEEFEDCCELIKYLSEHMTLKYKEEEHRPIGFDRKMAEFLRLKKLLDNEERWIN